MISFLIATVSFATGLPSLTVLPSAAAAPAVSSVQLISRRFSDGKAGNGNSNWGSMSEDGRYVAFYSSASDLVADGQDTNARGDVFVYDRWNGTTKKITAGAQSSSEPAISANGRYVAFVSPAPDLVPNDTNNKPDVFLHDLQLGTTKRVSVDSQGLQANGESGPPSVSSNGDVVFTSSANNLIASDGNSSYDIFLHKASTALTTRVSVAAGGGAPNGSSGDPKITANGLYVTFHSSANNLVAGDSNGRNDIFVWQASNQTISLVSKSSTGGASNDNSYTPAISEDGRFVAFASLAGNLVTGDGNAFWDVFVRDRTAGTTVRASVASDETPANTNASGRTSISQDGRFVAFASGASNLVTGDTNSLSDVFVRDLEQGTTIRASVDATGAQAAGGSSAEQMSPDGRYVMFSTSAHLTSEDQNGGNADVFVFDRLGDPSVSPTQASGVICTDLQAFHAVDPSGCIADPVTTATGAFVTATTDVSAPGIGLPFVLRRRYSSALTGSSSMGKGWINGLDASLDVSDAAHPVLWTEDGQKLAFHSAPDGTFYGDGGVWSSLRAVTGGYELTRRDQVVYEFNGSGKLQAIVDPHQNELAYSYDSSGVLSTITDTAGRTVTFTHDAAGRLTRVLLADGRDVEYGYSGGLLTSMTDTRGYVTYYEYDAADRLNKITDPNGNVQIRNLYGTDGRVIEQLDARGNKTVFSWNPTLQTATITDARNNQWTHAYRGNVLLRKTDPGGNTVRYRYDDALNVVAIVDAAGHKTTMAYDARGNMLTRTAPAPLSYVETFTYDQDNNVTSYTNGRGQTTAYEYDSAGALTKVTEPGNRVTILERDPAGTGLLTGVTDPRGKETTFGHDAYGNQTSMTAPSGAVTTMGYDASGRLTSIVDPRGNVSGADTNDFRTQIGYDAANHVTSVTDPLGNVRTSTTYDPAGRLASVTNARDKTVSYGYNAVNLVTSVTAPDSTVTSYTYDAMGNLASRTDAKNHTTTYEYDGSNRLIKVMSPTGQMWTYAHDANGNVTQTVDAAGNKTAAAGDGTTLQAYDALDRLKSINYSDSTPDVAFTYDANSNLTSMSDGAGTESYSFDVADRLTSVTRGLKTFSYEYDAGDNILQKTYPDGTEVDMTYNDNGQLATLSSGAATTTYAYDAAGQLVTTTLPAANGHVEHRAYDRAGHLIQLVNEKNDVVLSGSTYTLDAMGNPTKVVTEDATVTFAYDSRDRLVEACYQAACPGASDPFIKYTYDAVGNRLTEERPGGTTTYDYNAADQLVSTTGSNGTVPYSHDANGNVTQAGSRTLAYDLANRVTSVSKGTDSVSYTYDGAGKRITAAEGTSATDQTNYLWDVHASLPQLAAETDGNGALIRRYVHGLGLVSMNDGTGNFYYHFDGLGSVTDVTDAAGGAQWSYSYEPFGAAIAEVQEDTAAPDNPMRFGGELLDETSGLYHLRARQYDPVTGRFDGTDAAPVPVLNPYLSSYVYAMNRPTVLRDPSGLTSELIGDACSGFGETRSLACSIELMAMLGFEITMCEWIKGQRLCFTVALSGEYQEPIEHYINRTFSDLGKLGRKRKNPFLGGRCGWKCKAIIGGSILYGGSQLADN